MVFAFWTVYALRKSRGHLDALLAQRKLLLAWVQAIPLPYVAVSSPSSRPWRPRWSCRWRR